MNPYVKLEIKDGIGTIEFFHPQSNSLPGKSYKNWQRPSPRRETMMEFRWSY